jgi:peptidoglycan/LPS O-acetylase OafA/YrhL
MQRAKIDSLTGLRFLAALWVLLLHFRYGSLSDNLPLRFLWKSGSLGVPLFFILSGFILTYSYQSLLRDFRGDRVIRYLQYRIARIYPVHIAMLVFLALCRPLGVPVTVPTDGVYNFVLNALLVQSWGLTPFLSWNQAAWSVSSEWFAYLAFPLLIPVIAQTPKNVAVVGVIAFIIVAGLIPQPNDKLAFGILTLTMGTLFLSGCFLFKAVEQMPPSKLWGYVALAGIAMIVIGAYISDRFISQARFDYRWQFIAFAGCAATVASLFFGVGIVARVLGSAPMVYLGETSFSLYMLHIPTVLIMRFYLGGVSALWFEILVTQFAAMGMYHFVEKPAREWIRSASLIPNQFKRRIAEIRVKRYW